MVDRSSCVSWSPTDRMAVGHPGGDRRSVQRALQDQWTPTAYGRMYARAGGLVADDVGLPVVLVHGFVMSSAYMVPTARYLGPFCPVYAVDLPGYGRSRSAQDRILTLRQLADALAAWMERLPLPRAHFVANSFGCQILAEFAVRHPEKIARLVWQGPTIDPAARSFVRQLIRVVVNSRRERPGLGAIMRADYRAAGLRRILRTLAMALGDRPEEKCPRIHAAVLVVRGEHDPLAPQPWAEELVRLLPDGRLAVMAGLAHTINYAAPERFVHTIRPFLDL